jgi:ribonuclease Z
MAKIVFLGTAASISTKERDNTSFIFFCNKNKPLLVDCPGSTVKKIKERHLDYTAINDIIITHSHPDHLYGIPSLIHSFFKIKKNLNIYSSNPSIKLIKNLTKLFKLNKKGYPHINYINAFKQKPFFYTDKTEVYAFKNKHISGSFGINIIHKEKNIIYSSDTTPDTRISSLITKNTYLIHDCTGSKNLFKKIPSLYKMHTESSQLKKIILENNPKMTIPIHFLLINNSVLNQIKKELQGIGRIIIPNDYSVINIT